MLNLPVSRTFVLWRPVSAIAAVVRDDAVVLAADRAQVADGELLAPGVPRPLDDAPKLFRLPNDVVVTLAGKGSYVEPDGRVVNLRDAVVRAAGAAPDVNRAAAAVLRMVNAKAGGVRAHAGWGDFPCAELSVRAYTVALIAGVSPTGPVVHLVALTVSDPCGQQTLWDTTVFAPQPAEFEFRQAAYGATAASSADEAVEELVKATRVAAGRALGLVTLDVDTAVVGADGVTFACHRVRVATRGAVPTALR